MNVGDRDGGSVHRVAVCLMYRTTGGSVLQSDDQYMRRERSPYSCPIIKSILLSNNKYSSRITILVVEGGETMAVRDAGCNHHMWPHCNGS